MVYKSDLFSPRQTLPRRSTEGNFDGLTDNQVDRLIELGIPLLLGGGGIAARVRGDKNIYTPKGIPGQNKPEQTIIGDDGNIDII